MRLHSQRAHPPRLDSPPLSDEAWELIRSCWMSEASKRPRIEEVTLRMVIANLLRSRSVTLKPALRARDPSYEAPSIFESISRKLGTDAYHDIPPYPPFPNEIGQSHMLEYPYNLPIPRSMHLSWALVVMIDVSIYSATKTSTTRHQGRENDNQILRARADCARSP